MKKIRPLFLDSLLIAIVIAFFTCHAWAASEPAIETAGKIASQYEAGVFSVSPFASVSVVDSHEDFGAGLAVGYSLTKHLTLEADVVSEEIDDSHWDDAIKDVGASVKYYFPIKQTGFAPYLIGGYKRDLLIHENLLAAGAGVEFRRSRFAVFVDARVVHEFEQELSELGNRVQGRGGLSILF